MNNDILDYSIGIAAPMHRIEDAFKQGAVDFVSRNVRRAPLVRIDTTPADLMI
ncbi:hypothetical protein L2Y96_03370 [Luteibacter aegosomaticola]|uniref:hypothetical protein n=1 Tax=Luteibacter aegosomaticola TaxID=2911538 RepID=UPI001FF7670F|nr:hypothetical protein [Luteibacter aegosomaticola]UPG90827.1 hypothetical protein L2Y96_03370 [Luteibacter aegosomaticola]